jgi:hypothetical protein
LYKLVPVCFTVNVCILQFLCVISVSLCTFSLCIISCTVYMSLFICVLYSLSVHFQCLCVLSVYMCILLRFNVYFTVSLCTLQCFARTRETVSTQTRATARSFSSVTPAVAGTIAVL